MSMHYHDVGSLTGMARRWIKSHLPKHENPQRANIERHDAEVLERVALENPQDAVGRVFANSLLPQTWKQSINSIEERQATFAAEREAERLAEQRALAKASLSLIVRGAIKGKLEAVIPARIEWPDVDGIFAIIELESVEPVEVGGFAFHGLRIAIPANDALSGKPINLAKTVERHWRDWDPLDAQVSLGSIDDAFYWSSDYGSAHFWPEPGMNAMQMIIPFENANGERVSIDGTIRFAAA